MEMQGSTDDEAREKQKTRSSQVLMSSLTSSFTVHPKESHREIWLVRDVLGVEIVLLDSIAFIYTVVVTKNCFTTTVFNRIIIIRHHHALSLQKVFCKNYNYNPTLWYLICCKNVLKYWLLIAPLNKKS